MRRIRDIIIRLCIFGSQLLFLLAIVVIAELFHLSEYSFPSWLILICMGVFLVMEGANLYFISKHGIVLFCIGSLGVFQIISQTFIFPRGLRAFLPFIVLSFLFKAAQLCAASIKRKKGELFTQDIYSYFIEMTLLSTVLSDATDIWMFPDLFFP